MNLIKLFNEDKRWFYIISFSSFLLLLFYAWSNRFIQDDAFISFRYAQNLVSGHGLVFNPGEYVEGYTNFLWTILIALGIKFNYDPINFSHALSISFLFASLLIFAKTLSKFLNNKWVFLTGTILLGLNFSFSSYATGGLETALLTFLYTSFFYTYLLLSSGNKPIHYFILNMVGAFLLLTRLDTGLLIVIFNIYIFIKYWRSSPQKINSLILTALPYLLIVLPWLGWKLYYYGNILPNTFYAKTDQFIDITAILRGGYYLAVFFTLYLLPLLLYLAVKKSLHIKKFIKYILANPLLMPLMIFLLAYFLYIIKVGGDFMEFRFLVPILPFIYLLAILYAIKYLQKNQRITVVLIVMICSIFHNVVFDQKWNGYGGLESIKMLESHLFGEKEKWIKVGKQLNHFTSGADVTIAVSPAGAIPFYSELKTVDMLGLNDPYIARFGKLYKNIPGHRKIATLDYLEERKVNLIIGHPVLLKESEIVEILSDKHKVVARLARMNEAPAEDHPLVAIPIEAPYALIAWYVRENDRIEQMIENGEWIKL